LYRLQPGPERTEIAALSDEIADRMTTAAQPDVGLDGLDVDTALEIANSYDMDEDEDDEVLAAMLVLADEVRRLRTDPTDVVARRTTGAAIQQMMQRGPQC
jgi:hypothetical protein